MREYVGCPQSPHEVAFVPGDPPRLVATANAAAYVWPADGAEPVEYAWGETAWGEPVLVVSPAGRWLVAGPHERLRAWDLSKTPRKPLDQSRPGVLAAGFASQTGQLVLIHKLTIRDEILLVAHRTTVGERDSRDFVPMDLTPELESRVHALNPSTCRHEIAVSADGRRLAASPNEKAVHLWDAVEGRALGSIPLNGKPGGLALSPDGSRLAVDAGTTVYIHETDTQSLVAKWKTKYSYVTRLAWSPDGRLLARTDRGTTVRIYDSATGREVSALGGKRGALVSVAFSPDGLTLATGTDKGPIRVWDVE